VLFIQLLVQLFRKLIIVLCNAPKTFAVNSACVCVSS